MLKIEQSEEDPKIIKRWKKSLFNSFKIGRDRELVKAVDVANALVALGRCTEAEELLRSFVFEVESKPDRRDLWASAGTGKMLLAYLASLSGDVGEEKRLVSLIVADDYWSSRASRYELFLEDIPYYKSEEEYYASETPTIRAEFYSRFSLNFLYALEMSRDHMPDAPENIREIIMPLVEETYEKLKAALLS